MLGRQARNARCNLNHRFNTSMTKNTVDAKELASLVEQGFTRQQLADHFGVARQVIYLASSSYRDQLQKNAYVLRQQRDEKEKAYKLANKEAIKSAKLALKAEKKTKKREARLAKYKPILDSYVSGKTLRALAAENNVTYQRVQQIIRSYQLTGKDGGSSVKKREREQFPKLHMHSHRLGITKEEWIAYSSNGTILAYKEQKRNSKSRGIGFELNFKQWLQIWIDSGKIDLRGRGKGKYCMSRLNDSGPYAEGNVEIKTNQENAAEGFSRRPTKKHKGVFFLLKGTDKPWLAKYAKKNLGWFATEEEAVEAREKYMSDNGLRSSSLGGGRGYSFDGSGYVAQCCGKTSRHKSAQEATEAYKHMVAAELSRRASSSISAQC